MVSDDVFDLVGGHLRYPRLQSSSLIPEMPFIVDVNLDDLGNVFEIKPINGF